MKGRCRRASPMSDIYRGMTPFVILQLIGVVLCVAFPEIALWLPRSVGFLD